MRKINHKMNQKGISMTTLVITIIVMLILAGVSINLIKDNVNLEKVSKNQINAVESSSTEKTNAIEELTKKIDARRDMNFVWSKSTDEWTNQNVKVTVAMRPNDPNLKVETKIDDGQWFEKGEVEVTTYGQTVYAKTTNKQNNEYKESKLEITNIDKQKPTASEPSITKSATNKIEAKNNQIDIGDDKSEKTASGLTEVKYRLASTSEKNSASLTGYDWQDSNVFEKLTQGKTYFVQTKAKDKAGNEQLSEIKTQTTGVVPSGETEITATPENTNWINQDNTVVIATKNTEFTLEVSKDGKTWTKVENKTDKGSKATEKTTMYGDKIYARLTDGDNTGKEFVYTENRIDKVKPTDTAPTGTATTDTITATLKQTDSGDDNTSATSSGIDTSKTKYRLVEDATGTTAVSGRDWQTSNKFTGLKQNETYYIQTQVTDKAGNTTESKVSEDGITTGTVPSGTTTGIITLTADHTTWTNEDVKVTASTTQTGFTIQMSTDGKTYTDGTSVTLRTNGTVYARLRDASNNYGGTASKTISIIDKTAPTFTATIQNVSSSGYDVIIKNIVDTQSGIDKVQCPTWTELNGQDDIDTSWPTSEKSAAIKQEDGSYKYRVNVSDHNYENATYLTAVYAFDKAGNSKSITVSVNVPGVEIKYMSGNLVQPFGNIANQNIDGVNISIQNGKITEKALYDDGYTVLPMYVKLEANKKYHFSCKTDGVWGKEKGTDTVECFVMKHDDYYSYYIHMDSNEFDFIPKQTSVYNLRFDVNQLNKTHTFENIEIYEYSSTNTDKRISSEIGTLPTPTREGYTFNGWYTDKTDGNKIEVTSLVPANNVTYYTHWVPITYSIGYNLNGGSVSGNPTTYNADSGKITLKNPTKAGYNFIGWTGSNGTTAQTTVTIQPGSTGNRSYTAHFQKTITLTQKHGGSSTTTQSYTLRDNETAHTFSLGNSNVSYSGWTFKGWTNGATAKAPDYTSTITISDSKTVYATFSRTYTATFIDYNGTSQRTITRSAIAYGNGSAGGVGNQYGSISVPGQGTFNGWTSTGWSTGTAANSGSTTPISTGLNSNPIYYGLYQQTIWLAYNSYGRGNAPGTQYGTRFTNSYSINNVLNPTFTVGAGMSYPEYMFLGWCEAGYKDVPMNYYADVNVDVRNAYGYDSKMLMIHYLVYGRNERRRIGQHLPGEGITISQNTILYGQWYVQLYRLGYNGNGGTPTLPYQYYYKGQTLSGMPTATKGNGQNFLGWFSPRYKDSAISYYTDYYSDLHGWRPVDAWNHYVIFGRNEGRRISEFQNGDIFGWSQDLELYAGWY